MSDRHEVEERVAKWRAAFEGDSEAAAVTLPAPWPLIKELWEMLEESGLPPSRRRRRAGRCDCVPRDGTDIENDWRGRNCPVHPPGSGAP